MLRNFKCTTAQFAVRKKMKGNLWYTVLADEMPHFALGKTHFQANA